MSTDEEIPAVSDVENAKISDGTSTAGEHNVDKVNDLESEEKSTVEDENKSEDEVKKETNKRDINEVEKDEEKLNESNGEDQDETTVSTTNKKIKIIEPLTDEASPEVPNQELTVV